MSRDYEALEPSSDSINLPEQMDIEMEEQLNQLDQYLQYPFPSTTTWNQDSTEASGTSHFNVPQPSKEHYHNYCYKPDKCHENHNCEKSSLYPPNAGYQPLWQNQLQYYPTYQQYLPTRDTEKSYACSNI